MKSLHTQIFYFAQQFWRYKWISIAAAWLVCVAGWTGVGFVPTRYDSTARVYINADGLLTPLLHGLAADDDPERHLDYLQRTLLSRPNLLQLMHTADLDYGLTSTREKDAILTRLAQDIKIRPETPNLINISYRDTDPIRAKNVVQSLLTIFADNTTGTNRAEMENAKRFVNEQIASYQKQLRAAEDRRAAFHEKYLNVLPGADGAVSRADAAAQEVVKLQNDLADSRSKRDALKHELEGVPQFLNLDDSPQVVVNNAKPTSPTARLEAARANLQELRLKYTDKYPDVVATRREIAELESEIAKARSGHGGSARRSQIANVVYEQIKLRLVDAEGTVASIQRRLDDAVKRKTLLQQQAQATPEILAQSQNLDRDYGILKKNFDELLQRRESIQMSEDANAKANKIQFRIVDAPQVPMTPAFPNRPLLLSAVLVAGIAAALATPLVLLQFDHSFNTVTTLRDLGIPVLGSISRIAVRSVRRRDRVQFAAVCASAVVLLGVYGVLLRMSVNLFRTSIS